MSKESFGVIRADEAYSKSELLNRLGISQKFWDLMLDNGLPHSNVGHAKWVLGADVLNYMRRSSVRRPSATTLPQPPTQESAEVEPNLASR